jgi:nucleotide-binding universal stress UspA family protein
MFQSIVVGTDGSDGATRAVRAAAALGTPGQSRLHVVCVAKPPTMQALAAAESVPTAAYGTWEDAARDTLDTVLERAATEGRDAGLEVETHTGYGNPAEVLCDFAQRVHADVIVVGNRGMQGPRRFVLGSVPNHVSHHAPCSVFIVNTADPDAADPSS